MNKLSVQMYARAILVGVLGVFIMGLSACATPPVQAMSNARQAVAAAREAGAPHYAPHLYAEARHWLDDAEFNLKHWAYDRARKSASRAEHAARAAIHATRKARAPAAQTAPSALSSPMSPLAALQPAVVSND